MLAAIPAGAVGPSIYVDVQPKRSVGTPSPDSDGEANFTVTVQLLSNPITPAQIVVTVTDSLGWTISPSSYQWRVTNGGNYVFNFTVGVPNSVPSDTSDVINVDVAYRTGGVTVQTVGETVSAAAGEFRAGAVKRISPGEPMVVGKTYIIQYEVVNAGNVGATFVFGWADSALNSRLKANFELPQPLSLAGFNNSTASFRVTPQATTPDGTFQVPAKMVVTDRSGVVYQAVNFTIEMQFVNLPYPALLPRIDLTRAWSLTAWSLLLVALWLASHMTLALFGARKLDRTGGGRYSRALRARLQKSLVRRAASAVLRRRPRRRPKVEGAPPTRSRTRRLERAEED